MKQNGEFETFKRDLEEAKSQIKMAKRATTLWNIVLSTTMLISIASYANATDEDQKKTYLGYIAIASIGLVNVNTNKKTKITNLKNDVCKNNFHMPIKEKIAYLKNKKNNYHSMGLSLLASTICIGGYCLGKLDTMGLFLGVICSDTACNIYSCILAKKNQKIIQNNVPQKAIDLLNNKKQNSREA